MRETGFSIVTSFEMKHTLHERMHAFSYTWLRASLSSQGVMANIRVGWCAGAQYPLALELLLQLTTAEHAVPNALQVR